jgi:hypothetical protein
MSWAEYGEQTPLERITAPELQTASTAMMGSLHKHLDALQVILARPVYPPDMFCCCDQCALPFGSSSDLIYNLNQDEISQGNTCVAYSTLIISC